MKEKIEGENETSIRRRKGKKEIKMGKQQGLVAAIKEQQLYSLPQVAAALYSQIVAVFYKL